MTDLERAIADMEEARASHANWATYLRGGGAPLTKGHTIAYERMWIRRYNRVLRILRKVQA